MNTLILKRGLIGALFLAPAMLLIFFWLRPGADFMASLPLFHFYIVTFTTFSAAVISILLSVALRAIAQPRHFLAAVAFAVIALIFFAHGSSTPGALIDYAHPAVRWSAWLTLFGGGAIFALAALDGPAGAPPWLRPRQVAWVVAGLVALYLITMFSRPDWYEFIEIQTAPWHRQIIFLLTVALWLFAFYRLGQTWRVTRSLVDGVLAFVALWLAYAAVSMHQYPVWQISWWLYHFILLVGFLVTVFILLVEYEQLRQFSLLYYYLATSLIVTALLALLASYFFAQFTGNFLLTPIAQADVTQAILQARAAGLLITGLTMGLLFVALLLVVARADRIITARAQELTTAYTELRRAEALRDDLTSMIVHDLRNPLTTVYASLGLIRYLKEEGQTEAFLHHLEQARIASERMTGLIDDILAVSKFEAGQLEPKLQQVLITELLANRVNGFAAQASDESKRLDINCPPHLSALLDPEMIGRVVENLVSNALKYTRRGGQIQVSAWANNGYVQVRVRDDGQGVPDIYKQQIFEKYRQIPDDSDRPQRKGTGLGLAFCGLAVQAHAGQIWVEDAPGGGSDFIFRLPQQPGS